jgi:hypothetical protein
LCFFGRYVKTPINRTLPYIYIYIYGGRTFIQGHVIKGCRPLPRRRKVVGGRRSSAVVGRRRVALGLAVHGSVAQIIMGQGMQARIGSARLGLGSARLGSARPGPARLGLARPGSARLGFAPPLAPPGAKKVSKWLPAARCIIHCKNCSF